MAPGEVSRLKNGEPMMAGVLAGDYKDRIDDRLLNSYRYANCSDF